VLSVQTLVLGCHRTQHGDGSTGLQRCEQLGAGFSCEAGALDVSDTRASVHGTRRQQHGAAVLTGLGARSFLLGWRTPCASHLCWVCVALGDNGVGLPRRRQQGAGFAREAVALNVGRARVDPCMALGGAALAALVRASCWG